MPTTTNKQRVLAQLFAAFKKRSAPPAGSERSVLEQLLYAVCREGTTRELADQALETLKKRFFDWNEVRVSSLREIEEVFAELPNAEARAQRLISLLQEVFETTFSFDLEILQKKGIKQAAKQLSRYQGANDYAVAWVMQQSLGGHAIPLDDVSIRVLRRLGLLEGDGEDLEALRATVEHVVPKARGPVFNDLLSYLGDELCWEDSPNCPACPLRHECPAAQENQRPAVAAERAGRVKPR